MGYTSVAIPEYQVRNLDDTAPALWNKFEPKLGQEGAMSRGLLELVSRSGIYNQSISGFIETMLQSGTNVQGLPDSVDEAALADLIIDSDGGRALELMLGMYPQGEFETEDERYEHVRDSVAQLMLNEVIEKVENKAKE